MEIANYKLLVIDARKAHLNPPCEDNVYIELPEEAGVNPGVCGKLKYWLYGCRPAAQAWESFYAAKLVDAGFVRGVGNGVVFIMLSGIFRVLFMVMISYLSEMMQI